MPGRLAAVSVAAVMVVVVSVALLGRGDGRPPGGPVALEGPAATPTPSLAPARTPVAVRSPLAVASPILAPSPDVPERPWPPAVDLAGALHGDDGAGPLPLGAVDVQPNADRLDFLVELCQPECFRDAHWMDPENPNMGSGIWTAGRPFHVREGFVNDGEQPLGEGFDVVIYVSRADGGSEGPTYRYTSDFVLRGTSDRCGPTYRTQTVPQTCEWFVHDFPEGLPAGRFTILAVWEAPCWAWIGIGLTGSCRDPDEVISRFWSGVNAPFGPGPPDYTEVDS